MPHPDPRAAIRDKALALGFDAVGFAEASLGQEVRERLALYLAEGRHGDMGWMAEHAERRGDPRVLWPEARSVIALGMSYAPDWDVMAEFERPERGVISAYARGRDYHDVMKKAQKELAGWIATTFQAEVKVFVDTAPVMEKPLAQQAGLGWQGKHTCVVSRKHGGWLFLGEIFTTLPIEPDPPHKNHCGSCQRCLDICPTKAFPAPYQLDARRCLAYLTIEHKGPIPHEFRAALGNRVYGCDDCIAVCPWNSFAQSSRHAAFKPKQELNGPTLLQLAQLDDPAFRILFAGTPVKRTGRDRFVRNVLIALGNGPASEEVITLAKKLAFDASPLVRGAAVWCLRRLRRDEGLEGFRVRHLVEESDPQVREEWQEPLCHATVGG